MHKSSTNYTSVEVYRRLGIWTWKKNIITTILISWNVNTLYHKQITVKEACVFAQHTITLAPKYRKFKIRLDPRGIKTLKLHRVE